MSLTLYKRKGSPNWHVRGTVCGRPVDQSTETPHEVARLTGDWYTPDEAAAELRISRSTFYAELKKLKSEYPGVRWNRTNGRLVFYTRADIERIREAIWPSISNFISFAVP